MKLERFALILALLSFGVSNGLVASEYEFYKSQGARWEAPEKGCVPDEKTAIAVADAMLSAAYSKDRVDSWRPFSAKLFGDQWEVVGHLPKGADGGTFLVRIARKDGAVSFLSATK